MSLHGLNPVVQVEVMPGWYPALFPVDMSRHWEQVPYDDSALSVRGTSFFLLPSPPVPGACSRRFDPCGPYFQSVFGVYVIPPLDGTQVPVGILPELVRRDYVAWLRRFGDPEPWAKVPVARLAPEGTGRRRLYLEISCHLDTGQGNPQTGLPVLITVPRQASSGSPHWSNTVHGYDVHTDVAHGYVWYESGHLIYCWFVGTRFTSRHGDMVDTYARFPQLLREQEDMAASVRVLDRGTGYIGLSPPAGLVAPTGEGVS
ncbi:hypothetical protein [Streptomyces sirii]|uniref:hypothetical protein n=1 Tax=Streptomyces sirii TaxID=3127701 RepID=UPI003D36684B